ncbi:flavin reductase family protein [Flexivirga sp.]|uniref:flavin reductase family protein n=1 Tax=Flexivirga sp. TaxID=1962927 RepID=UPI003F812A21
MSELMWNFELYENADEALTLPAASVAPQLTDPRALRDALGNFATGVVVLTYEAGGVYYGVTVNSFTSVSMEPPLVLISMQRSSRALGYLLERPFAVNIMGNEQLLTALQFAGKPQTHQIEWVEDDNAPWLNGSLAHFQCTPWAAYDGGDHVLVLGQVSSFGQETAAKPLLFYQGAWRALALPNDGSTEAWG